MLDEIRPLLTGSVEHLFAGRRDLFGQIDCSCRSTTHAARIITAQGRLGGPASREMAADAKATIWLLNHPRAIGIGDTFKLPDSDILSVIGCETRTSGSHTLHKVHLS